MPEVTKYKPLGKLLVEQNLISPQQLEESMQQQRLTGKSLGKILVETEMLTEEQLLQTVAGHVRMVVIDLDKAQIEQIAISKVPASIAQVYNIMPIKLEANVLTVAISDPLNLEFLDDLRFTLGCNIQPVVASEDQIQAKINQYYPIERESIPELVSKLAQQKIAYVLKQKDKEHKFKPEELQGLASQAPVVKLLNLIIMEAVKDKASDIHFEPFGEEFKIRYRIDGQCVEAANPPKDLNLALASRIKVMANLDVTETRLPQDGRILTNIGGKKVDLRVSTLPTVFGESIVLRILDKSVVSLSLDQAGLTDADKVRMRALIRKPNGIILVTGPTGSGKTTTLYSCLKEINRIDQKIITTEDPVEYDLSGIIQVNIRPKIGLTFARCLRHILRQDPDIIMVGEIRDQETAEIAIQAALTGHLVFSTLHTNDASGAITRLLDMGIPPFLITSTLTAVLAQRLVRAICPDCKHPYPPSEQELSQLGLAATQLNRRDFFRGRCCPSCKNSGYKGRTGIFELFVLDDKIRSLILQGKPAQDIKAAAIAAGMQGLREDGLNKIWAGLTTAEEVLSQTQWFA